MREVDDSKKAGCCEPELITAFCKEDERLPHSKSYGPGGFFVIYSANSRLAAVI